MCERMAYGGIFKPENSQSSSVLELRRRMVVMTRGLDGVMIAVKDTRLHVLISVCIVGYHAQAYLGN